MDSTHSDPVGRAAQVLDYMIAHPADVGISELSRKLGYSKSVIHRILNALRTFGYVAYDEDSRRYCLGFKSVQLGLAALSQIDIRRLALRRMERLRAQTRETVNLSIRVGDRRVYIESLESPQELRQRVELGREMVLYLGASSKAIFAFLPVDDQERILQEAQGQLTAAGEPISLPQLRADLEETRQRGYAASLGERLLGAASVAAPIHDHLGHVVASISVSGPAVRWTTAATEQYGALVAAETTALSRDLGYEPNRAEEAESAVST